MNQLLNTEQLSEWIGCKHKAKMMRWLNDNGVPYRLNAKGEPITTMEAVNASLMDESQDKVSF